MRRLEKNRADAVHRAIDLSMQFESAGQTGIDLLRMGGIQLEWRGAEFRREEVDRFTGSTAKDQSATVSGQLTGECGPNPARSAEDDDHP